MIMRKKNKNEKKLFCAIMSATLLAHSVVAEGQSSLQAERIKTIWQDPIEVTQKRLQGNYANVKNFLQEKSAAVYATAVNEVRKSSKDAIKKYVKDQLNTAIFKIGMDKNGDAVVSSETQTWSKIFSRMGIDIPGLPLIESGLSLAKIFGISGVPTTNEFADSFIEKCVNTLSEKAEERVWNFIERKGNKESVKTPDVDEDQKGLSRKEVKEIKADLSGRPDRESQWNNTKWSQEDVKNYVQFAIKTKINEKIDGILLNEIKSQKSKVAKRASELVLQELAKISMPGYIPSIIAKPVARFSAKIANSPIAQLAEYFKLNTWSDEKINDKYDSFKTFLPITESELERFYQRVIKSEERLIGDQSFQDISVAELQVAPGWYSKLTNAVNAGKKAINVVKDNANNALNAGKNVVINAANAGKNVVINAANAAKNVPTFTNIVKNTANVFENVFGTVSPKNKLPIDNQNYGNKSLIQGVDDMGQFKVGEVGDEERGPSEDTNDDQNFKNSVMFLQ